MHHRTAEFREIFTRTLADLKTFIGTKNDVLILASSGSGAMEASVSNLTAPGDKVLVLTAGNSASAGAIWQGLWPPGRSAQRPYGEPSNCATSKSKLEGARVLYMQATELDRRPPRRERRGRVAERHRHAARLDAITGLGTTDFDVDGWGIDILIGGSQKALMIPPGLAYLCVSERAWQRMEQPIHPRSTSISQRT